MKVKKRRSRTRSSIWRILRVELHRGRYQESRGMKYQMVGME